MNKIQIIRPLTIKARVTERLKGRLVAELQATIRQIEAEMEELDSQLKRATLSPNLTPQQQLGLRQAVELEKEKRAAEKQELMRRVTEVASLPLGGEVVTGTVQALAEVGVGDDLDGLLATEVLVEDGRVVAIRRS